ncbi:MAG: matrixin family metalloprotease [Lachnospiraceae bacterium]|nr:matrixin family metalloprotease [Lachnospiraceae bacterium]
MRKVREGVAKWMSVLVAVNMAAWMVGGNAAMAKCEDPYKCSHGFHAFKDIYLKASGGGQHGTRYVYVSNDFKTSGYRGLIINGCLAWNMKGNNKIRLATTSSKSKSQIRIEPEVLGYGVCGMTYYKKNGDSNYTTDVLEGINGNYKYAKIEIYETTCQRENVFQQTGTHECGHALGLSHVTCRKSIMCYSVYDSPNRISSPSNADYATLRHVYNAYK